MNESNPDIAARLEYLRAEIDAERISMSELIELQNLTEHIDPGDTQLLEWAGVPEFGPVFYCAYGVERCTDCRPLLDAGNVEIPGTDTDGPLPADVLAEYRIVNP